MDGGAQHRRSTTPNGKPLRVVGVSVDVTERKRALVELRAFTETLEEARQGAHARTGGGERGPQAGRGIAAPGAEDGSGRPAHRRRRARLQQSADDHSGRARHDRPASCRRCRRRRRSSRITRGQGHGAAGRAARRHADQPAAGLLAPAAARPASRSTPTSWWPASASSCAGRSARRCRSKPCWPAACGARFADPNQLENASSISRSTPATPCRTAAS